MSKLNKIIALFLTLVMVLVIKGEINGWYDQFMIVECPVTLQIIGSITWYLGAIFVLYKFDINKILDYYKEI